MDEKEKKTDLREESRELDENELGDVSGGTESFSTMRMITRTILQGYVCRQCHSESTTLVLESSLGIYNNTILHLSCECCGKQTYIDQDLLGGYTFAHTYA